MPTLGQKVRATLIDVITAPFKQLAEVFFGLFEKFTEAIANRIDRDMQVASLPAEKFMIGDLSKSRNLLAIWNETKGLGVMARISYTFVLQLMLTSSWMRQLEGITAPVARREIYSQWPTNYPFYRDMIPAKFRGDLSDSDIKTLASWWGYASEWYDLIEKAVKPILDPRTLQDLTFRGEIPDGEAKKRLTHQGFTPAEADLILKSWPRPPEFSFLRDLTLRGIFAGPETTKALKAAGYPEDTAKKLQELFFYIPPPPDLVRMAVREAFTPEIAERFGQYQDFPAPFAEWAKKQGMSDFWARAYWAAHWDLPSPLQGFEMLHRQVITKADLELLLRALDVMPFWRDRLIQISYRPYTRVDVRRMHQLGILDTPAVKRSYLDLGYDEEKAENMTKFTIAFNASDEKDLTRAIILDALNRALIPEGETEDMLEALGYSEETARFLIQLTLHKRTEAKKKQVITNVKTRFERGVLTEEEATGRLLEAGLTQAEIDELIELWLGSRGERIFTPPVGKLEQLLREKIISADEFSAEMVAKGCSQRYISWYIALHAKEE